jgi:hypothetical protein
MANRAGKNLLVQGGENRLMFRNRAEIIKAWSATVPDKSVKADTEI